jgi:Transglycosylase SLT domain
MRLGVVLLAALLLAGCDSSDSGSRTPPPASGEARAPLPAPDQPIPRDPGRLAQRLASTTAALHAAIDRWREEGDTLAPRPPREVTLHALYQQRMQILLSSRERLYRAVVGRLPARLAADLRDTVAARRGLAGLTPPVPRRLFETGAPQPAGLLLRHYREAQRRFHVAWPVLAAVNFVESAFGRLRNDSTAGAQGPMQFIPATWRAYGLGGDVHDPHDAILGAANYLHASGAPRDYGGALYAYNPSPAYVDAVLRYARRIRRDPRAYFAYHSRQVFVRTPAGIRRITGP